MRSRARPAPARALLRQVDQHEIGLAAASVEQPTSVTLDGGGVDLSDVQAVRVLG